MYWKPFYKPMIGTFCNLLQRNHKAYIENASKGANVIYSNLVKKSTS